MADEPLRLAFEISGEDDELDAMRIIVSLFGNLTPEACHRVVRWAQDRFCPPEEAANG